MSLIDNIHSESITSARSDLNTNEYITERPVSKLNKSQARLEPLSRNKSNTDIDNTNNEPFKNEYPKLDAINQKNAPEDEDKVNELNPNEDLSDNYVQHISYTNLNNNSTQLDEDNLIIDKGNYKIEIRSKSFLVDNIENQLNEKVLKQDENTPNIAYSNNQINDGYINSNENDNDLNETINTEAFEKEAENKDEIEKINENNNENNNQVLEIPNIDQNQEAAINEPIQTEFFKEIENQNDDLVEQINQNQQENTNEHNNDLQRRFEQLTSESQMPNENTNSGLNENLK